MTKLHRLHDEQGQSPWLDSLTWAASTPKSPSVPDPVISFNPAQSP